MAKEQRAKTERTSQLKRKEKPAEQFAMVLDSSDDEAPEEVTFEDSKSQALQNINAAVETIRREKELQKEKRRKRQELFQEQKRKKLLPVDVLEEIGASTSKPEDSAEDEGQEKQPEVKEVTKKKKKKKSGKDEHSKNFMGTYKVTTGEDPTASFQQKAAEDFIKSRLYGPGSCRSTNNEMLSIQSKKGEIKAAAVQFVKKDWASSQKAKAEKLKKRWIHEQHILT